MNSSRNNNQFTFSLYQGNVDFNIEPENVETVFNEEVLLVEKVFDADVFNPFTRYSIDIRDILPHSITKLQKLLSKRNYDTSLDVGNDVSIDFKTYNNALIKSYRNDWKKGLWYSPKSQRQVIDGKVIKGVPCRLGLYINDNPIVERIFYVDNFNPVVRYSMDVVYAVIDIVDEIFMQIRDSDVKNMWDDYDLINKKGYNINQIREMSHSKRAYLIRTMN